MINHFVRDFIFDDEQIKTLQDKLVELEPKMKRAGIYSNSNELSYQDARTCDHVPFRYQEFPDISLQLLKFADELGIKKPEDLWFAQFEFIRYEGIGQQFTRHNDDSIGGTRHNRHLTSVTMIEKSEDLIGGKLKIWTPEEKEYVIDLEPFETVIFPAYYYHEATTLLQGRRVVLISWAQSGR